MQDDRERMITPKECADRLQATKKAQQHKYTPAEIAEMVKKRQFGG